jgi:hypothetical protein
LKTIVVFKTPKLELDFKLKLELELELELYLMALMKGYPGYSSC